MTAKTIPILPSKDFDETSRFYAALGFVESGRWPGEYLTLLREAGIELHFWSNSKLDPRKNDVACYVRFDTEAEARALFAAWESRLPPAGRLHPPQATDYGLVEFALIDPHGNLLRIGGRAR